MAGAVFSCCHFLMKSPSFLAAWLWMFVLQSSRVQQVVSNCYSSNITMLSNRESKNIHKNFRPLSATVFSKNKQTYCHKITSGHSNKMLKADPTHSNSICMNCTSAAFCSKLLKTGLVFFVREWGLGETCLQTSCSSPLSKLLNHP